jgi:NADH-quinone oxidoreductase subunit G
VRAESRLTAIQVKGQPGDLESAIAAAAELLKTGNIAVVGSGQSSVEEQFLTKKIADALKAPANVVARVGEGDKLLISADRNPNTRGALVTGLISKFPAARLTELAAAIDAGSVRTVLAINEDLAAAGLSAEQLAKVKIVYVGTHGSATTDAAQVVVPTHTVFEKNGTFINQQFRLQKFCAAIPGLAGTFNDLVVLTKLLAAIGGGSLSTDIVALWQSLAVEIKVLAGASFATVPETGVVLNSTDFAKLEFPEGESLHYKPVTGSTVAVTAKS